MRKKLQLVHLKLKNKGFKKHLKIYYSTLQNALNNSFFVSFPHGNSTFIYKISPKKDNYIQQKIPILKKYFS